MTKAYSNKALPAGTVLREWRLEEVLGVGGFGIVYKGRGIYFDELVAIKEYFPSSISERDSDDTVVPIDSDAEEVHALGLKKFVEEAKLLWNLSTPSRHPNIVSVRSLFEIHGTAYMVMDFEDGTSLSKMVKQGRRFNERSLWNILRPIAEGLDRAHRVGVLHRDIKPPNILINEDNRPVLIDFGSARFEAAEATSTKVTFHTPPYAAIEQYVKTYPQGPWTDIYALGVVMYECITGEKPPEVLERLHAGLGKPLSEGKWPGYTKRFLAGVDAAMVVKPDERPQSIGDWLAMFGKDENVGIVDGDDATRFYAGQVESEGIVPVPPTPVDLKEPVETGVPKDPKEASFKRAGEETGAKKRKGQKDEAAEPAEADGTAGAGLAAAAVGAAGAAAAATPTKTPAPPPAAKAPKAGAAGTPSEKKKVSPAVMAGAAAAVLAVVGVGALTMRGGSGADTNASEIATTGTDNSEGAIAALGTGETTDVNAAVNETGNAAVEEAAPTTEQPTEDVALRKEQAKAAAAEARLEALQKAQMKAAQQAKTGAQSAVAAKSKAATATASTSTASEESGSSGGGVSKAKLAQFYSIVDDARSQAKRVMKSGNSQNAALARNYDANLKTLRDSMRGIQSDRDADRLIKQANQTRAYVQFLGKDQ
ncbi:serine/threonine protein kinase [Sphingomonas hankyongi]|uniref:Serine/threonine protein kinase n=1 Tax=Sphingomonas hankyongi TaxID=2908209 RepID=A0ABT0RYY9_9SPHN|nr:serine/threonine-protein kinase [Sphingomonas hankyongi]MCL6728819.1 serine/threonine protein kinase [Sphingomonas hankyongi]